MDRLTVRDNEGRVALICRDGCNGGQACIECEQSAMDRLAAYEDTGLTPEEIKEFLSEVELRFVLWIEKRWGVHAGRHIDIMMAESAGRLVLLPCKVTDTVYIVETVFENRKMKKLNKPSGEQVVSAQIDHVTIGGTTGKPVFDLCTETGNWYYSMEPEQFYLTREAAEAALKEQEG